MIVFGLNEAPTLKGVVEDCLHLRDVWGCELFEVILVDDGSTDATPEIARELAAQHPEVKVVTHPHNLGIGESLRSGYAAARHENVCAVPADAQFDLSELEPYGFIAPGTFLSFYRATNPHYNWFRHILSWGNRAVNRWGTGIRLRDVNWIKAYKLEGIRQLKLEMHSLLVESEICGKLLALDYKLVEIPSKYLPRDSGISHVTRRSIILRSMRESLKMVRAVRRFRTSLRGKGR